MSSGLCAARCGSKPACPSRLSPMECRLSAPNSVQAGRPFGGFVEQTRRWPLPLGSRRCRAEVLNQSLATRADQPYRGLFGAGSVVAVRFCGRRCDTIATESIDDRPAKAQSGLSSATSLRCWQRVQSGTYGDHARPSICKLFPKGFGMARPTSNTAHAAGERSDH